MQNPSNLAVTRKSRELAVEVYRVCHLLPDIERFGLASQMRRAAVSVGSNIAEGCGRHGDRALLQFLHVSMGSASELEFQLELTVDLGHLTHDAIAAALMQVRQIKRMLSKLIASLRRSVAEAERKSTARATDRLTD